MKLAVVGTFSARPAALVAAVVLALAGCRGPDANGPPAAARVNKREISVQDVEYVLGQRGSGARRPQAAGREVLEQLIDQELALQAAVAREIDRDPQVQQQLEAARREIVARAYLDRVAQKAPAPSKEEIVRFFESHPQLFAQRRIYTLRQIKIDAPASAIAELNSHLASDSIDAFMAYVSRGGYPMTDEQVVRPAEQLPMASLPEYARLREGEPLSSVVDGQLQIDVLVHSRLQPTDLAHAEAAIAQLLLNDRRRQMVADDLRSLRAIASLQYFGEFAQTHDSDPRPTSAARPATVVAAAPGPSNLDKEVSVK